MKVLNHPASLRPAVVAAPKIPNPFSTAFVSPAVFPFLELACNDAPPEIAAAGKRFVEAGYRGQIVGPHGSGKTTLTFAIENWLRLQECEQRESEQLSGAAVFAFQRPFQRKTLRASMLVPHVESGPAYKPCGPLPRSPVARPCTTNVKASQRCLVIDGIERLSPLNRLALIATTRFKRIPLIVTSHRAVFGIPLIARTTSTLARFEQIAERLQADSMVKLNKSAFQIAFERNKGNVREALMALYDVFENAR